MTSLGTDLDLTGVAWKPIGGVFDGDNLPLLRLDRILRNGHTISNLDFSRTCRKAEYPRFSDFSAWLAALKISGLTIQGKLDVSIWGCLFTTLER